MSVSTEIIEMHFPVVGARLPSDHAYHLFSALSKIVPAIHDADWLGIQNIEGTRGEAPGMMHLLPVSRLRLRMPAQHIQTVYAVAGKSLNVGGFKIQCGPPTIFDLRASSRLRARTVILKPAHSTGPIAPDEFLAAVRKQINERGIKSSCELEPDDSGAVKRRIVRIAGVSLVGYSVVVSGLTDEDSLSVQRDGVGGRRKLGCGIFVAIGSDQ